MAERAVIQEYLANCHLFLVPLQRIALRHEAYLFMENLTVNFENNDTFYDSLPQSFSRTDADSLANTLGVSARTIDRWLTNWTQQSVLQRIKQGEYGKVS